MDFEAFLNWERTSRDTIDVKKIYIDMADDFVAGVMLSQIVYWYLPTKSGDSKLTVIKSDKEWLAKARHEWWDECRISPKQVDRALRVLVERGIVETKLFKYDNTPTKHIRILKDQFLTLWQNLISTKRENPFLPKGQNPISPKGEIQDFTDSAKSITKTTAETTTKTTAEKKDSLPTGKVAAKPKYSKAELDAYYEAIAAAWQTEASGWIVSMRGMLMGEAKRGAWKECNFSPPATPDEITAFAKWWSYKKLSMPTQAESIQRHFYEYRKEKAKPEPASFRRVTQEELDSGVYQDGYATLDDLTPAMRAALDAWLPEKKPA